MGPELEEFKIRFGALENRTVLGLATKCRIMLTG
jgi:hypothetical protein